MRCAACRPPCGGGSKHEDHLTFPDFRAPVERAAGDPASPKRRPSPPSSRPPPPPQPAWSSSSPAPNWWSKPCRVKDKDGKPVEGLTAKDFTITEDGVPQKIAFCEFQKLRRDSARRTAAPSRGQTAARHAAALHTRRRRRHRAPDYARTARRHTLSRPPPDGPVLRHERHAGARPDPRRSRRHEVRHEPDAEGGPDGGHGLRRRLGEGHAGFHRQQGRLSRTPSTSCSSPTTAWAADTNDDSSADYRRGLRRGRQPSSTSSPPTGSWARCRPPSRCWAR